MQRKYCNSGIACEYLKFALFVSALVSHFIHTVSKMHLGWLEFCIYLHNFIRKNICNLPVLTDLTCLQATPGQSVIWKYTQSLKCNTKVNVSS